MNDLSKIDAYGVVSEPATLTIRRMLPGPVERIWSYLVESDLRRQWLASGDMQMKTGTPVKLVWHNDKLTTPSGERPEGFGPEHSMECQITHFDPPRKLSITWGSTGGVTFELEPKGNEVLLTLTHSRLPDRSTMLNVSAGWHAHLDILVARASGKQPPAFWDHWRRLKQEYERRLPA